MKIEINNLAALVQGRELNLYQRSLAVEEWHKLIEYTTILESAINSEFNAFEKCTKLNVELLALKQANGAQSENGKLPIPHVSQQSEQLVNFLWEQYKINRLITKKAYMQMVANARKLTNCG